MFYCTGFVLTSYLFVASFVPSEVLYATFVYYLSLYLASERRVDFLGSRKVVGQPVGLIVVIGCHRTRGIKSQCSILTSIYKLASKSPPCITHGLFPFPCPQHAPRPRGRSRNGSETCIQSTNSAFCCVGHVPLDDDMKRPGSP